MAEGNGEVSVAKSSSPAIKVLRTGQMRIQQRELEKKNEVAHNEAVTDALTGLPNRRWLFGDGAGTNGAYYRIFEKARADAKGFIVLMMDVKDFKKVNDTLGHDAGDRVLKGYADHFKTLIRHRENGESDVLARTGDEGEEQFDIARTGGDEFVAILQNTGDLTPEVITKIIAGKAHAINDNFLGVQLDPNSPHRTQVRINIGAAVFNPTQDSGLHPNELIKRADQALYASKKDALAFPKIWNKDMAQQPQKVG